MREQGIYVPRYVAQKTTCGSEFCPSTVWDVGTKLRTPGLVASSFTCWTISPVIHAQFHFDELFFILELLAVTHTQKEVQVPIPPQRLRFTASHQVIWIDACGFNIHLVSLYAKQNLKSLFKFCLALKFSLAFFISCPWTLEPCLVSSSPESYYPNLLHLGICLSNSSIGFLFSVMSRATGNSSNSSFGLLTSSTSISVKSHPVSSVGTFCP